MPNIEVPNGFIPRNYQLDCLKALEGIGQPQVRRALLRWHRQSGKDTWCWAYMCLKAATIPSNYFYFFPQFSQARRSLWEKMDEKTGRKHLDMIPDELVSRKNNQDMLIELKNGSTIRMVGSDNYDSVLGITAGGLVFSEYAYSDPMALIKMMPALDNSGGWLIVNSTPQGRNHFYDLENQVKTKGNWYVSELQTMWPERPNYSGLKGPEGIDDLRLMYEEDMIEQEYGVSFTAGVKGSFYADCVEQAYADKRISTYDVVRGTPVNTYWDLGRRDDTAIWFCQIIGNAYVFVDYYEQSQEDIVHFAEVLKEKGYNYGTHYLPWDGNNKTLAVRYSVRTMLEYALRDFKLSNDIVVADKVDVQQGIQAVRQVFPQCHFDEGRTIDGIRKLEAYHRRWDSKRQVFLKEPVHDWSSHAADAFRTFGYFEMYEYGPRSLTDESNLGIHTISQFDPLDDDYDD